MTNIITLATAWGPKFGGINSFNYDFTISLKAVLGSKAEVFCSVLRPSHEDHEDAKKHGVKLIELDKDPQAARYDESWAYDIGANAKKDHEINSIDHWIGHDVVSGQAAKKGASLQSTQSSLIMHMAYEHYQAFKSPVGQTAKIKGLTQTNVFKGADYLFANGPLLRDALTDMASGNKVTMLVPGLADINPNPPKASLVALTFGRMEKENSRIKQGALAVAAFGSAVKKAKKQPGITGPLKKGARIKVVGIPEPGGEEEQALRDLFQKRAERAGSVVATEYEIDRKVHFSEISKSNIALMLSWHEGFGLVGWEAIAAEVPLILGKDSGLYKLLEEAFPGAESLTKAIDVRGHEGDEGSDAFTEQDELDVRNAIIEIAENLPEWQKKAQYLKRQLKEELFYTWDHTAKIFCDSVGLDYPEQDDERHLETEPFPNTWFELYDEQCDQRYQIDWRRNNFSVSKLSGDRTNSPGIGATDYSLAVDAEGKVVACLQEGKLSLAWLNRLDVKKFVKWPNTGIRIEELADAQLLAASVIADRAVRVIAKSADKLLVFRVSTDQPEAIEREVVEDLGDAAGVRAAMFADKMPELFGRNQGFEVNPFAREVKEFGIPFGLKNVYLFDSAKIDERHVWVAVCEGQDSGFELTFGDSDGHLDSETLTEEMPWCVVVTRNCRPKKMVSVVYKNKRIDRFGWPEVKL